jgi:hypothetical protein
MFSFLKKNKSKLLLVASLSLNVLGGAGIIPPVLAQGLATLFGAF